MKRSNNSKLGGGYCSLKKKKTLISTHVSILIIKTTEYDNFSLNRSLTPFVNTKNNKNY